MSFSCKKGEFDRCFNRLDRPVEESQPDWPVNPIGFYLGIKLITGSNHKKATSNVEIDIHTIHCFVIEVLIG